MEMNHTFRIAAAIFSAGVVGYLEYKKYKNRKEIFSSSSSSRDSSESFYTALDFEEEEYFSCSEEWPDILDQEEILLYEDVDKLMEGSHSSLHQAFSIMSERLPEMSNKPNFLWRYAKVHQLMANELAEKTKALCLITEGVTYAKEAIRLDKENPEAHKWYAILRGKEGELEEEIKEKVKLGLEYYEHIQKALELNRQDWYLHYLLGRFQYEMADMSYLTRKLAYAFFKLPECNYSDARKTLVISDNMSPRPSKATKFYLAKCLYKEGLYGTALECLMNSINIRAEKREDKLIHEEAEKLKPDFMRKVGRTS